MSRHRYNNVRAGMKRITEESFNSEKYRRIELSKKLVGKLVSIKGKDSTIYKVTGRNNKGYVYLDNETMQDVNLLIVVESERV